MFFSNETKSNCTIFILLIIIVAVLLCPNSSENDIKEEVHKSFSIENDLQNWNEINAGYEELEEEWCKKYFADATKSDLIIRLTMNTMHVSLKCESVFTSTSLNASCVVMRAVHDTEKTITKKSDLSSHNDILESCKKFIEKDAYDKLFVDVKTIVDIVIIGDEEISCITASGRLNGEERVLAIVPYRISDEEYIFINFEGPDKTTFDNLLAEFQKSI